ncbi:NADPH-dependent FMN reductase [Desmospora activa]|uniref:FMN reductase n=1 Tax=Desmospora activa DSM 45169 TaxID=1121389 RepID=A0A2T4ZBU7_9BACL|nr:NADPH-dependent FMN reductase [Desmospora activa]PTM59336.1 FMN reductase [Desmospora activa DSM 45169]
MGTIVTLSGSPSATSRTSAVLTIIRQQLAFAGWQTDAIKVRDLPPQDLIYAHFNSPALQETIRLLKNADGVIIATPVYKASYTGVLKAYLDLLPQEILEEKVVWPIAVGGSLAHLLTLDYALKPVLYALGAQTIIKGVYIQDSWVKQHDSGQVQLEETLAKRIHEEIEKFQKTLASTNKRGEIVAGENG